MTTLVLSMIGFCHLLRFVESEHGTEQGKKLRHATHTLPVSNVPTSRSWSLCLVSCPSPRPQRACLGCVPPTIPAASEWDEADQKRRAQQVLWLDDLSLVDPAYLQWTISLWVKKNTVTQTIALKVPNRKALNETWSFLTDAWTIRTHAPLLHNSEWKRFNGITCASEKQSPFLTTVVVLL